MMESFHSTKFVQHCIGKCIKGGGLKDALVETKVYVKKVAESLLLETRYS